MVFTYDGYRNLIEIIKENNYTISLYDNWEFSPRCVVLRHDVDNDLEKAVALAQLEESVGVKSTFFILVSSDFYNVFSAKSCGLIRRIQDCGHAIGLHFDEERYPNISTATDAISVIQKEADRLSEVIDKPVSVVSMHRPSKMMLESDLEIPGIINSYSQLFFKSFKYVSDSRRRWREPVEAIIASGKYDRLHILTHAIWYNDEEIDLHDSVCRFVNGGNMERYLAEQDNIKDLQSIMEISEVK